MTELILVCSDTHTSSLHAKKIFIHVYQITKNTADEIKAKLQMSSAVFLCDNYERKEKENNLLS